MLSRGPAKIEKPPIPAQGDAPACLGCGGLTKHYGDFTNHEYECEACGEFTLRVKRLILAPTEELDGLREALLQIAVVVDANDGEPDSIEPGDWEIKDLQRAVSNTRAFVRRVLSEAKP